MEVRDGKVYWQCGRCKQIAVRDVAVTVNGESWGRVIGCLNNRGGCGAIGVYRVGTHWPGVQEAARNLQYA